MDSSTSDLLDPYKAWLGIPAGERPPNHYELLGLHLFESEEEVIRHAARERTRIVRPRCLKYREMGTEVLNQIARARVCLTNEGRKAEYDADLRERLGMGVGTISAKESAAVLGKPSLTGRMDERVAVPAVCPPLQSTLEGHAGPVTAVAFGKYGRILASSSRDGTVRIWNLATGKSTCTKESRDYYSRRLNTIVRKAFAIPVTCVALSPDEAVLASGAYDGKVKLWDVDSGELRRTLTVETLAAYRTPVSSIAFRSDGVTLASASHRTPVRVWNVKTGELLRRVANPTSDVVFSPDGRILASTDGFWDLASDRLLSAFGNIDEDVGCITCMAYSPVGSLLASGSLDCSVRLWDVTQVGEAESTVPMRNIGKHEGAVQSLAFSPDGLILATSGSDASIMIWEMASGACLATLRGHSGAVRSVAFNADGFTLASGSDDGTIKVWALEAIKRP